MMTFALLLAGALSLQAQKACCSGKDKAACAKEASAKAACCDKNKEGAACAKMEGTAQKASLNADAVTAEIRIYGNCGMCKRTIEGALKEVEGVASASWDIKSGMLTVAYLPGKINEDGIKKKVAAVGYDSDTHRAPDEVYSALHACCQYERPRS